VRALGDIIVFAPPYVCTEGDVRKILDAVEAALDEAGLYVAGGGVAANP